MERISKYPKRATREECLAFLATLPADNQIEGEELWERLDKLALLQAWAVVDGVRLDGATKSKKRGKIETPWMSSEEVAEYLGLSAYSVREAAAKGKLPGHKFPKNSTRGVWRFHRNEVDEFMSKKTRRRRSSWK